jgi:glucokinase
MQAIGIDIGGTNLRLGVFEETKLLQELRFEANFSAIFKNNPPLDAWQKILTVTAEAIEAVLQTYPTVKAIGLGFPGFINPSTGVIASSPNLPGLQNVNLAKDLSSMLNRMMGTSRRVVVENDANAAAYGEYCLAGKPSGGLIYAGLGTGVGGGLILNGKPYAGQHGCAMEIGHVIVVPNGRACGCGNEGCMEQYASASGVVKSYYAATKKQNSAAEIAKFAKAGDLDAIQAYLLAANTLAEALASILKVLDVNNLIIGGGMAGAWDLMASAFNQRLHNDLIPVLRNQISVKISEAEDIAGMLGAAMLANTN